MVVLGYLFTIATYTLLCISRFMKNKKMMLTLDLFSKILMPISFYCFNSYSGVYIFIAVFLMLFVANIKERMKKKWLPLYLLFQTLYLIILYFTYAGISSILVVITVSVALYTTWWLPPQQMRIIGAFNGMTYLSYQLSIQNWAGLLEIFVIISNFISYFKAKKHTLS